ncbi:MAG: OmpA family protein [bacterium]
MNKRVALMVVLSCVVAVAVSGCRTKKNTNKDGVGDVNGIGTGSGIGIDANSAGSRIDAPGTVIDAQLTAVQFAFDSAQVDESERAKAESAASYLKAHAGTFVTLEGNCDERGSTEYNMSLGERRAQSVRSYLMNLGVDASRIQTKSFGKEKPKDQGHDEKAWSVNRRVEFVVTKQ